MNAVVFGGSGFLGSHVCDKLSDAGHDVTIADLRPSPWLRADQKMVTGDILDRAFVGDICKNADIVFNFAGIADLGEADSVPVKSAQLNVMGNMHILDACRQHNIKKYVFASSLYVYGRHGGFYRCSKQACELYIETWRQSFGLDYLILRYGSLYGPRADMRNGIYKFVHDAMKYGKITYYGSHNAIREYIHVEDAADCTLKLVEGAFTNDNISLTGVQTMRVSDLFTMIGEILGKKLEIVYTEDAESSHYHVTPYSFTPRIGKKMFPNFSVDMGQGMLRVMEEISNRYNTGEK